MRKTPGNSSYGSNFTVSLGIVKNNADPGQHGRLQIYIPSLDSRDYLLEDLPWANYISPFGGTTTNFKVGREKHDIPGISSYGFWAIPKIGGQVLCGFIESEPHVRFWMGCIYIPEYNRTMPSNIDYDPKYPPDCGEKNRMVTELDDSENYPPTPIKYMIDNLKDAGLDPCSAHYKTRGGYERSISHPSNRNKNKPTDNGYYPKPLDESQADSQTICLTSPGKHYIVMSDVDEYCRIRVKTTEGQQIIMDDTNERIYISTAKGRNWVEMDETNGKIYIYSDSKINIRSKNDINFYSDNNINLVAKNRVNIRSEERAVQIEAKHDVRLLSTDADIMATASRDVHIKTLNGPKAPKEDEELTCESPVPHSVYKFSEKGGSSTSMVRIDTVDAVEVQISNGPFEATAKKEFNLKSLEDKFNIQAKLDINQVSDTGHFDIQAKKDINIISTDDKISQQSKLDFNILTTNGLLQLQAKQDKISILSDVDTISIEAKTESVNISSNTNVNLESKTEKINILSNKDVSIQSKTNSISLQSGIDVHIKAGGSVIGWTGTGSGGSAPIGGSIFIEGGTVNLYGTGSGGGGGEGNCCDSGGPILHNGLSMGASPASPVNPSTATPALPATEAINADLTKDALFAQEVELVRVIDRMIRPDHESWERDEDEANCKTERNKKFQG